MDKSKSKQIWQKRNDTAVVVHAFYADLVDELSDNLKTWELTTTFTSPLPKISHNF